MTSGVAVIGLSYDGFDLQRSDLDIMFAITEGLDGLPLTRGDDPIIPFRRGRLPQNHVADRRPVVAQGWITGHAPKPAAMYRAYLDSLKAHLDPTGPPRRLMATLEDGSARWIDAVPRNLMGGNDGMGSDFRSFSIEWDALDPYWYGQYGFLTLDSGHDLDEGDMLDSSAEMAILVGTTDITLDTLGTADVERVRVRFIGPSAAPVGLVVVGSNQTGFLLNRALSSFEVIEVNNLTRTAVLISDPTAALSWPSGGSTTSIRNLMTLQPANFHGEYLRLPPGPVTLRAVGGAAETRVMFNPTYS